jgi:hypothetical protein
MGYSGETNDRVFNQWRGLTKYNNKLVHSVLIMLAIASLSSITITTPYYNLLEGRMAYADQNDKMLTYENSNYGIRIQYPSNWYKENINSGSHNYGRLVDLVKFSPSSRNTSNNIESLDIKVDNISDIQPITLAKYANNSIQDLRRDFNIIELCKNASLSTILHTN